MRIFAAIALLALPTAVHAQYPPSWYLPSRPGPYVGVWTGPAFGYYPGQINGFWTNGYSLYGPPVPTYGSIPGAFGGSDQRLSNFPDYSNTWFGPWGWRGQYIPLNSQPVPRVVPGPGPAICEIRLPAADAELFVNGIKVDGHGQTRRIAADIRPNVGLNWEFEARWSTGTSIGAAKRTAILRAGEQVVVEFGDTGGK